MKLDAQWEAYHRTIGAGYAALFPEVEVLHKKDGNLYAEGDKFYTAGCLVRAKARITWMNAVIAEYGNCIVKWTKEGCVLENGDTYEWTPGGSRPLNGGTVEF